MVCMKQTIIWITELNANRKQLCKGVWSLGVMIREWLHRIGIPNVTPTPERPRG